MLHSELIVVLAQMGRGKTSVLCHSASVTRAAYPTQHCMARTLHLSKQNTFSLFTLSENLFGTLAFFKSCALCFSFPFLPQVALFKL